MKKQLILIVVILLGSVATAWGIEDPSAGSAFRSTSIYATSSSNEISNPGAEVPQNFYSTTETNAPSFAPRKATQSDDWEDPDETPGDPMPVGDPWSMALMAGLFAMGITIGKILKKRKEAKA